MAQRDKEFLKSVKVVRTKTGKQIARGIKSGKIKIKDGSRAVRNKGIGNKLKITKRREMAAKLRTEGSSFAEIARIMRTTYPKLVPPGYDDQTARADVNLYLDTVHVQTVDQVARLRNLELMRMDWMTTKLVNLIETRSISMVKALELMLRVSERRAKLAGLDAPVRVDTMLFGDIRINYGGISMDEYEKAKDDPDIYIDADYEDVTPDSEETSLVPVGKTRIT